MDRQVWKVFLNASMTTASSLIHYKYRPAHHVPGEELLGYVECAANYCSADEGKMAAVHVYRKNIEHSVQFLLPLQTKLSPVKKQKQKMPTNKNKWRKNFKSLSSVLPN